MLHGGLDSDTARYDGNRADYIVTQNHGVVTVQSQSDPTNIDTLVNIEHLSFADGVQTVDYESSLQWITTLYSQVLHRQADLAGVQYWADRSANGMSMGDMALSFMFSPEAGFPQGLDMATVQGREQAIA